MMSKNVKRVLIGLIILVAIVFLAGKATNLFSVVPGQVSDGYFLYGTNPTTLTNSSLTSVPDGDRNCPANVDTINSAYWDTQSINGQVTGGDTALVLNHDIGATCGKGWSSVTSKQGFSGRDFRADLQMVIRSQTRCQAYGTATVQLVNGDIPNNQCSNGNCPFPSDGVTLVTVRSNDFCNVGDQNGPSGLFELHRNVFSNSTDVYWQGQLVKNINTTGSEKIRFLVSAGLDNPYQSGSGVDLHVTNARYRPIFSCALGPNDLLAMESFSGGQTSSMNISSLRFPVKSFCLAHPAILTDSTQGGSTSTAEPYQLLINGQSVPITNTQTLTLFYVFDNSAGIVPTQCSVNQGYNTNTSSCQDLTGIVQVCSQGILDSSTGLCVVQPSVTCSQGTYNNSTGQCQYVPPTGVSCPTDYTYNNATGICEKTPTTVTSCQNGRLDLQTGTCVFNPPVTKICSKGTYNNATDQCELKIDVNCPSGLTYDAVSQSCKGQPTSPVVTSSSNQTTQTTSSQSTSSNIAITTTASSSIWFNPVVGFILFLLVLAILYLIFFTGMSGKRRWGKFKEWVYRNKEGILIGAVVANLLWFMYYFGYMFLPWVGAALDLLRAAYPLWVVLFIVNIIPITIGAIVDALIKPKK